MASKRDALGMQPLQEDEAWAAIGVLAMTVDGSATREEHAGIVEGLARLQPRLSKTSLQRVWTQVTHAGDATSRAGLLAMACRTIPPNHAQAAYHLACAVALADGVVTQEEERFLQQVQAALGLSDKDAGAASEAARLHHGK